MWRNRSEPTRGYPWRSRSPEVHQDRKSHWEQVYQKKTPIEHVLLRPDTYVGSVEDSVQQRWTLAPDNKSMAGVAISIASSGAFRSFETTPLMTQAEVLEALQFAGGVPFAPGTGSALAFGSVAPCGSALGDTFAGTGLAGAAFCPFSTPGAAGLAAGLIEALGGSGNFPC